MNMTRTTVSTLLASLATVLLLAGCGTTAPSPTAPEAAGSGPTESAPHAVTAPHDLCPLLTADEVARVLGGPAKSRSYVDEALGRPTCYWKRTDSQGVRAGSVMLVQNVSAGDEVRDAAAHPETMPGARRVDIGEAAYLNTQGVLSVHIPAGDDDVAVIVSLVHDHPSQSDIDTVVNLAKQVYSRLR
jgi:hypothetical protein